MKKLGPLIAISLGAVGMIFATLSLLAANGTITNMNWLGDYESNISSSINKANVTATTMYGILIAIGAAQFFLGMFTWKNPKGFSAFILMALFGASAVLAIIAGVNAHNFPTVTIIKIVIDVIATLGILLGWTKA